MLKDKIWFYFVVSILILIVTTPIRYESLLLDLWVTHIIYFAASLLSIKWSAIRAYKILLAFITGFLTLYIIVSLLEEFSLLFSLNIFSYLLAILNGYLFVRASNWLKKGVIVLISILYCYIAINVLAEPFLNLERHGTFDGHINNPSPSTNGFITEKGDTVIIGNIIPEKILVIDIWSTSCGLCFKQFPLLESLYTKYKDDNRIEITAMNVPLARDTSGHAINMIRTRHYNFPISFSYNGLDTALNVYAYPATIIIHKNRVIYRGDLKSVDKIITQLL